MLQVANQLAKTPKLQMGVSPVGGLARLSCSNFRHSGAHVDKYAIVAEAAVRFRDSFPGALVVNVTGHT